MQHTNACLSSAVCVTWSYFWTNFEVEVRDNLCHVNVTKIYISCKVTHDDKTMIYVQNEK